MDRGSKGDDRPRSPERLTQSRRCVRAVFPVPRGIYLLGARNRASWPYRSTSEATSDQPRNDPEIVAAVNEPACGGGTAPSLRQNGVYLTVPASLSGAFRSPPRCPRSSGRAGKGLAAPPLGKKSALNPSGTVLSARLAHDPSDSRLFGASPAISM